MKVSSAKEQTRYEEINKEEIAYIINDGLSKSRKNEELRI